MHHDDPENHANLLILLLAFFHCFVLPSIGGLFR